MDVAGSGPHQDTRGGGPTWIDLWHLLLHKSGIGARQAPDVTQIILSQPKDQSLVLVLLLVLLELERFPRRVRSDGSPAPQLLPESVDYHSKLRVSSTLS